MSGQSIFLFIFGAIWTVIVMLFNGFIFKGAIEQQYAQSYLSTEGVMTYAEVDRRRGSDSTTYAASLEYEYAVGGETYTGTRYQVQDWSSSNRSRAARIVREHQPGTRINVYYDPDDPEKSVLHRDADGMQYMLLVFMIPFNAVMLGFWWKGGISLWRRITRPPAGGFVTRIHPPYVHVNVEQIPIVYAALGGAGGFAFVMIFVLAFAADMEPSPFVARLVLLATVAIAALAGAIVWRINKQPKRWLSIDEENHVVFLPVFGPREKAETIDFNDVQSISVASLHNIESLTGARWAAVRSSSGRHSHSSGRAVGYGVVLHRRAKGNHHADAVDEAAPNAPGAQATIVPAARFTFNFRAEMFGRWLADRMGVPFDAENLTAPAADPRAGTL